MSDLPAIFLFFVAAASHNPAALQSSSQANVLPATEQAQLAPEFARLDADGDGFITRKEAQKDAEILRTFRRADADKDGKLTPREFAMAEFLSRMERPVHLVKASRIAQMAAGETLQKQ